MSTPKQGKRAPVRAPRCECGGRLRPLHLETYDFSPLAGIPVTLKSAPGLRCDKCGGESLTGDVINGIIRVLALETIKIPGRLPAEQARYLRRCLGLTQQELADRLGVARETVGQWEIGRAEISAQHDLNLRTITLSGVLAADPSLAPQFAAAIATLNSVRASPPARRPRRIVLDGRTNPMSAAPAA